jgi:hypothetical protein
MHKFHIVNKSPDEVTVLYIYTYIFILYVFICVYIYLLACKSGMIYVHTAQNVYSVPQ